MGRAVKKEGLVAGRGVEKEGLVALRRWVLSGRRAAILCQCQSHGDWHGCFRELFEPGAMICGWCPTAAAAALVCQDKERDSSKADSDRAASLVGGAVKYKITTSSTSRLSNASRVPTTYVSNTVQHRGLWWRRHENSRATYISSSKY